MKSNTIKNDYSEFKTYSIYIITIIYFFIIFPFQFIAMSYTTGASNKKPYLHIIKTSTLNVYFVIK